MLDVRSSSKARSNLVIFFPLFSTQRLMLRSKFRNIINCMPFSVWNECDSAVLTIAAEYLQQIPCCKFASWYHWFYNTINGYMYAHCIEILRISAFRAYFPLELKWFRRNEFHLLWCRTQCEKRKLRSKYRPSHLASIVFIVLQEFLKTPTTASRPSAYLCTLKPTM